MDGCAMMSVFNTTEVELEVQEPVDELDEVHQYGKEVAVRISKIRTERERDSDATEIGTFECGRKEIVMWDVFCFFG
jgi:hypothetical protein